MTASLTRRWKKGLQFQANYTFSKTIDDNADFNNNFMPFRRTYLNLERSLSNSTHAQLRGQRGIHHAVQAGRQRFGAGGSGCDAFAGGLGKKRTAIYDPRSETGKRHTGRVAVCSAVACGTQHGNRASLQ
jgi:hypothetical protein